MMILRLGVILANLQESGILACSRELLNNFVIGISIFSCIQLVTSDENFHDRQILDRF